MMKKTNYSRPLKVEEITEKLLQDGENNKVMAGGTDLIGTIKGKVHSNKIDEIVSLKGIGKNTIIDEKSNLTIGAMTTLYDIEKNDVIKREFPVLWEASHQVASPQIRKMATIGGNICQEVRCWYYRYQGNKFNCIRKGGDVCNALTGNNTYHSIFGASKVFQSPCENTCPNNTPIAKYLELVRENNMDEAASLLLSKNPLAGIVGRICPHTCQDECSRNNDDESVSIHDIERYVGDYGVANAKKIIEELPDYTGKNVAIIGAGPAGLTAAYFLAKKGHKVTVYDANEKAGGMLIYGIPGYRLSREVVSNVVEMIAQMGVTFVQNTVVGKDVTFLKLKEENDALLVCIGAWQSIQIGCKGDDREGVIGGIEFLYNAAKEKNTGVKDKIVAVVGGGNTAMDACRTAKRLGASQVYNLYRRTRDEMPAEKIEVEEALEEGVEFLYLVSPEEILKSEKTLNQIKLQKMKLGEADKSGRRKPVPVKGDFELLDVDFIISAIGQNVDSFGFDALEKNSYNCIMANEKDKSTNFANVFAAGDGAIGPKTAIEAIADARKAVEGINKYLLGEQNVSNKVCNDMLKFDRSCLACSESMAMPIKAVEERTLCEEDRSSASLSTIEKEASRCYNCGCVGVSPSDIAPALIALNAEIITNLRSLNAKDFFATPIYGSTVLEKNEIVLEIKIGVNKNKSFQSYQKFRTRKTIDFPIIGLASNVEVDENGIITDAKLVFSGIAPIPYELKEVERYLIGKTLTSSLAKEAADLAIKKVLPLEENAFKVQITHAYVQRAVNNIMK